MTEPTTDEFLAITTADDERRVIWIVTKDDHERWQRHRYIDGTQIPAWRIDDEGRMVPAEDPRVRLEIDVEPFTVSPVTIRITADQDVTATATFVFMKGEQSRAVVIPLRDGRAVVTRELAPGDYVLRATGMYKGDAGFTVAEDWASDA